MTEVSEVQVSYSLAREDKNLTMATVTRVFENGCKILAHFDGEDAEAFIDAWNGRVAAFSYREALDRTVKAWDVLKHGNYTRDIVETWLEQEMKPSVEAARALLAVTSQKFSTGAK